MSIVKQGLLGLLGLALIAIWGASAAGNFAHGVQLSGNSPWWPIIGAASAAADIAKGWALIGFMTACKKRAFIPILASAAVWAVTTAWGIVACTGFISTLLADTASGRAMHGVADTSLKKQIDDQVGQITKLQDLKMRAPARDWDRIEGEIGRVDKRLEDLRVRARAAPTVGAAEPFAALLLKRYGVDEDSFRLGKTVIFLLMVEVCASMGFVAFAPLFGTRHDKIADDLTQEMIGDRPPPPAPPLKGDGKLKLVPASPLRMQALELLAKLEGKYGAGSAVWTAEVWNAYLTLAKERGWQPMASHKLGQQLALLGVTRSEPDSQRRKHYVLPTAREKSQRKKGKEEGGLPVA